MMVIAKADVKSCRVSWYWLDLEAKINRMHHNAIIRLPDYIE